MNSRRRQILARKLAHSITITCRTGAQISLVAKSGGILAELGNDVIFKEQRKYDN